MDCLDVQPRVLSSDVLEYQGCGVLRAIFSSVPVRSTRHDEQITVEKLVLHRAVFFDLEECLET